MKKKTLLYINSLTETICEKTLLSAYFVALW